MPHSADCLCGRSQNLSPAEGDKITIDRPTLERIFSLLNGCSISLEYLDSNHVFVEATESYLETLPDSLEIRKALKLLDIWTQTCPDASKELTDSLDEARESIKFILAASAGGGNE